MTNIGKVTLQSDENGLITLQCDRCKSRFKMECDYLNNELEGDICCPICGIPNEPNTFYPEEVIEAAQQIAMMEVEEMLQKALKGLNSKYVKVKTPPINRVNHDLVFKNSDYDMHELTMSCCQKRIGLKATDSVAGVYCPYCGRIAK